MRIDIIGAGISGLSTAYYLGRERPDAEIHVWERDRRVGGLGAVFDADGVDLERFYHHIFTGDEAMRELLDEIGLGNDLVWRPASTGAYFSQRPYRLSTPADLLRFSPLPPLDRLRLGWLAVQARRVRDWRQLDDISAREYLIRTAGRRVFEVVWEPLLAGKFGIHADRVSAAWVWAKLVDRGGSRRFLQGSVLGYVRGGLGRLFDRLVERLRSQGAVLHLGTPVRGLRLEAGVVKALMTDDGAAPTDLVVATAQTPDTAALLPPELHELKQQLGRISFLGVACLVMQLPHSLSKFYWTNVHDPQAPFVGVVEQSRWVDPAEVDGRHLVYVSAYLPHSDRRLSMDAASLLAEFEPHLAALFAGFDASSVERTWRWCAPHAQPVVTVGYRGSVPAVTTEVANLFLSTMAQIYPGDRQLSNGIAQARRTVREVCRLIDHCSRGEAPS